VRHPVQQHPLAILAYGSLLYRPGPELSAVIVGRVSCRTPFPVEYARASERWGGGPVLTPHPAGGPVEGQLLLLADAVELGPALDMLAEREGLPDSRGIVQVADCAPGAGRTVLTAALARNLPAPDMTPGALAARAIASVGAGERNGIAYLRGAIGAGVDTPRTRAYSRAVLELCGAHDLSEAERLVA
jgi:hypothetical protein